MSETARFQETLRRLAIVDEAFVGNQAGLGLDPAGTLALDTKTISLLQLAVLVATGSPRICLEWSTARAMSAGATDDEIVDVGQPPSPRLAARDAPAALPPPPEAAPRVRRDLEVLVSPPRRTDRHTAMLAASRST
jgi:Carboxymuconolactone decarboxylase family